MTPDPDLTADVEHWLTDQIRTNWPNITADVLDDDERPAVAAWFATEMARFEAWRREQGSGGTGMPPDRPEDAERLKPSVPTCRACRQPINLADGAWNFSGHKDTGSQWWHSRCPEPARPMPPPKPGTHESDLCDDGVICCQLCAWNRNYIPALTDSELAEYNVASYWSRIINRTTERTA